MSNDTLSREVRRARRRMTVDLFVRTLPWWWFGSLCAAAAAIVADKFARFGVDAWVYCAGAIALGLAGAIVWTLAKRAGSLEAAIEIDRRFGLKERVSSALALDSADRRTPAGSAVWDDAVRQIERIAVDEQFRVAPGRWSWLPFVPALVAVLVALFLNPAANTPAEATTTAAAEQIQESTQALRQQLIERRKKAEEEGLEAAEDLFAKLEQGAREMSEAKDLDQQKALMRLNDLAQELEKRRTELGGADSMREQFKQFKQFGQGPADTLLDAVRNADFAQALDELEKLREALKNGDLDEREREQLAKQLADMADRLNDAAEAQKKAEDALEQRIAERRAAGDEKAAQQLEDQLAAMRESQSNQNMMRKLAQQLGQCQQCLNEGDQAGALESLEALAGDLEQMQSDLSELRMLDEALDGLSECKNGMCQGLGNRAGQGKGDGLGRGRGEGERPEKETPTGFYDSKVDQQVGRGALLVTDLVAGPNVKGNVQEEVQSQFEAVTAERSDLLTDQQLPREYREHARKYFDSLREGK